MVPRCAIPKAEDARLGGFRRCETGREPGGCVMPLPRDGPAETPPSTGGPLSDSPGPARRLLPGKSEQKCVSLFRLPGERQRIEFRRRHGEVFDSPSGAPVATVVFARRAQRISGALAAECAEGGTGSGKRRVQSSAAVRSDGYRSFSFVLGRARNRSGYGRRVWGGLLCWTRFAERAY